MRKILHAFRVHLHRDRGLSEWSSVRYVTVAGALLSFCEERGHALDQGRVPASILIDFAASCDDARAVRGAVLFCEFLRAWGVALPELDPAPGTLNEAQVEAFLEMAASQPEPYATLLCLLPWSGLRAQDLLRLPRDAVREGSDGSVSLVHEGALVGLGARAQERLRGYLAATSAEEGLLFPGQSGEAIGGATITRRLKQCRVAAGLPEFRVTALSDAYQVHYFEPAPAWPAGGGLDGLGEFVDESPGSAPEVLDDPSAIDPSAAEPSVDEEVSLDPPSIPPDDPNEAPSMTYDDEPYDDDEPDDLEPYEDDRYEPGSSEPGEPREPLRSRGRRRGRRRSAARSSRPRPSGAQNARVRDVDGLLPRSGHIEIRFRDPERGGRPRYCGRYLVRDVAPDGSIEAFIYEHLAPNLGGGEYLIFTSASDLQPRAVVDIAPPPPHARPSALGGQEPERQAGESSFEAGFRAGRRDAMREPYPAPPFGYDAGPALGLPLPAPEPAGPPSWFVEERRLQYEREKDERKAQLEREEREERRREREWQERREREEREFQRRQAELERQRVELERREERMEQRRKEEIAAAAAAAHPFEAVGATLEHVIGLTSKVQKLSVGNDNATSGRDRTFDLIEALAGPVVKEVVTRVGGGDSRRPRSLPKTASAPRPKRKAKKPKKHHGPQRASPTAGVAPEEPSPPEPELPTRIPGYVKGPARQLERAIAEDAPEATILERLIGMLAALGAAPMWTPFVQAVLMHLVRDDMEQTLQGLGAILGVVARAEVLEESTAHRVLNIADERWDEAREAILVAYQQRQAGAAE